MHMTASVMFDDWLLDVIPSEISLALRAIPTIHGRQFV